MKIKAPFDTNVFFTSDTHYGHHNILKFQDRPFSCRDEMRETMINNWNNKVPYDATVFHLGDFALSNSQYVKDIIIRLSGKIHLIVGNHERTIMSNKGLQDMFESVSDICEIKVEDDDLYPIILCHYPMLSWRGSHYGSWHLFGHVHGKIKNPHPKAYDVGIDTNNYTPVSFKEIKKLLK